ncbi:MAG TPA: hypothetical protein VNN73_04460 [Blastocatellia bacterium]|nr:hypothetical protein [Blastocatellia bacterium]
MKIDLKSLISNARRRAARFTTKLKTDRRAAVITATVVIALGVSVYFFIKWINNRIRAENDRVEVRITKLRAPSTDGLTIYLNSSDVRAVAAFKGIRYLATSGGLVALDDGGSVKRRYTTSDGLPENDLVSLAVFRDQLFIGTAASGMISFDGTSFTGYAFVKPKAARVTALVPTKSELFIGTIDGGLFEYDGETFTRRYNATAGADFNKVTSVLPFESRVYIGTLDSGLYIWREAHIERVTTNEGLPSPHVTALTAMPASLSDNGSIAVATDFGVVGLNDKNEVKLVSNRPNVTSLAVSADHLWAGLFSGGVVDLTAEFASRKGSASAGSMLSDAPGLPPNAPAIVYAGEGSLWALTTEGAFVRDEQSAGPGFQSIATGLAANKLLAAGHITGLAFDGAGHLWIGYFDRGVDTVSLETNERLKHIEDDRVREINYLAFDSHDNRLLVATSRGLVIFNSNGNRTELTREQSGLIDNSVTHVSLADLAAPVGAMTNGAASSDGQSRTLVLTTAGGLTEIYEGRPRSLNAFHGLASNHLFASAAIGPRLFVGSNAGLVELDGLRVIRTYKVSNSRLSDEWVTALANVDGTLYIGTNEGGVDALLPTGEWVSFADQVGKFEVSQNAIHFDGERLYVGTGEKGLLVYNVRAHHWTQVSAGLTSQTVIAITSDDQFVYVGTMNGLARIEKRVLG